MEITCHGRINMVKIMSFAVGASVIVMPVTGTSNVVYASTVVHRTADLTQINTQSAVSGDRIATDIASSHITKFSVKSGGSGFHNFFSGIAHTFTSIVHSASSSISSGVKAVTSSMGRIAQGIGHVIGSTVSGIAQGIGHVMGSGVSSITHSAFAVSKTAFSALGNIISGLGHIVGGAVHLAAQITQGIGIGVYAVTGLPGAIVGGAIGVAYDLLAYPSIKNSSDATDPYYVEENLAFPVIYFGVLGSIITGGPLSLPLIGVTSLLDKISRKFGYSSITDDYVSTHSNPSQSMKSAPTISLAVVQNSPATTQDTAHAMLEKTTKLPLPTRKSQDIISPQVSLLG